MTDKPDARTALMDAAERLLIERGYDAVTTRVVAAEAGVNHGLVHYYFGSVENLLAATLDRFTGELLERQRVMYAEDRPFIEKWRTAMSYLEIEDRKAGYSKLWLEMQAMSWNRPELAERLQEVNRQWRIVLTEAFSGAIEEYGLDPRVYPVEAIVTLVNTFNLGIQLEAIGGMTDGHDALLALIDRLLVDLDEHKGES